MAFAGHLGVSLNVDLLVTEGDGIADSRAEYGDSKNWARAGERAARGADAARALQRGARRDDPGADRAPRRGDADRCASAGLSRHSHVVGKTNDARRRRGLARREGGVQRAAARAAPGLGRGQLAHRAGCATTRPCADAEHDGRRPRRRPGPARPSRRPAHSSHARPRRRRSSAARPKVAILREQGVNSHVELSYAMDRAGFETYDVHMTDLQSGRARLDMFQGFVACGGFSYGDTLGAGEGWARSILLQRRSSPTSSRPSSPAPTCSRSASATAAR